MPEYAEPDLTPADARKLRAFLTKPPVGHPQLVLGPGVAFACWVEARLREDAAMLARVAPWLLTARLVTRNG